MRSNLPLPPRRPPPCNLRPCTPLSAWMSQPAGGPGTWGFRGRYSDESESNRTLPERKRSFHLINYDISVLLSSQDLISTTKDIFLLPADWNEVASDGFALNELPWWAEWFTLPLYAKWFIRIDLLVCYGFRRLMV